MTPSCAARREGFSLVEVVLALAVTSFCLIVLLGILPVSLSSIKNSTEETAAVNVISTVVADIKSTPLTATQSPNYQLTLPTAAPVGGGQSQSISKSLYLDQAGALLAGPSASGARYKVTITMSTPTAQNTITGIAQVSWPAQAATPSATVESYFAFDRN